MFSHGIHFGTGLGLELEQIDTLVSGLGGLIHVNFSPASVEMSFFVCQMS